MPTKRAKLDDRGQTGSKGVIRTRSQNETRYLTAGETPRERMLRVVQSMQQKRRRR